MAETDKLTIEFNKLGTKESLMDFLKTNIPAETLCMALKAFYAMKLGEYMNDQDYEKIEKLEGLLELHNLIQGTRQ